MLLGKRSEKLEDLRPPALRGGGDRRGAGPSAQDRYQEPRPKACRLARSARLQSCLRALVAARALAFERLAPQTACCPGSKRSGRMIVRYLQDLRYGIAVGEASGFPALPW
jgi:hypothetical protein